ncbi:acyl-[acyl-carrier-protein] thioesterase [Beduini massiliensis]|uniref:acyl-[acyl-carrier-protein] thioesterase n=1 Tax=Beduini massiliensis TaxID=1585974 RepID=UPI000694D18D|nr:acyl-ACP thioesterase domain-containing protein [Beduini massiliensis]
MLEYKKDFEINYQNVDYTGKLKLSHLLDVLSNVATTHAVMLNVWNGSLIEQYGWVLSKMHLEIEEPITAGDYQLLTYPGFASKVIFPRYYQLLKEEQPIMKASSIWTLLDLKKRRITMPKRAGIDFPKITSVKEEIAVPQEMTEVIPYQLKEERTVRYSDIDTNQHMNNARYLEWACDLMDYTVFKDQFIHTVDIFFKHEIAPNEKVSLFMYHDECHYYFKGTVNEINCFEIKMVMKNK